MLPLFDNPATSNQEVLSFSPEVSALLAGSQDLAGTLELDDLLRRILDRLKTLVGYTGAGIVLREGDGWITKAARGPFDTHLVTSRPVNQDSSAVRHLLEERVPLIFSGLTTNPGELSEILNIPALGAAGQSFSYIRSWMGVPLLAQDDVIGLLFVDSRQPNWFTPRRAALVEAFSSQVATAVRNARLYGESQRRVAELNGLQRATNALLKTLDVDAILKIACHEAHTLVRADSIGVFAFEDDTPVLVRQYGILDLGVQQVRERVAECCPLDGAPEASQPQEQVFLERGPQRLHLVILPLKIQGDVVGALTSASAVRTFEDDEIRVLGVLADNVSLALTSADLIRQSQQAAVTNERQRLAVQLHDTVTQALYGAGLLVDAVSLALKADRHEAAAQKLERLAEMLDEAMRGMRVMVFELRPPNLEDGLAPAIETRLASVESRVGLKANLAVHDERQLPEDLEVQVFWIVTEALNNIIKHAGAQHVRVELRYRERQLMVTIEDDGQGFNLLKPERQIGLGLTGMRERSQSIGGELLVESAPGQGSRIMLTVPIAAH